VTALRPLIHYIAATGPTATTAPAPAAAATAASAAGRGPAVGVDALRGEEGLHGAAADPHARLVEKPLLEEREVGRLGEKAGLIQVGAGLDELAHLPQHSDTGIFKMQG